MGTGFILVALVVIGLIALTGAASASVASIVQTQGLVAFLIVLSVMAIGIALYIAMSQKKGHTRIRPGRSAKALNTALVLAMIVVNTQHTRKVEKRGIVTPKIDKEQHTLITIPDE